jgi:hypothetical protein
LLMCTSSIRKADPKSAQHNQWHFHRTEQTLGSLSQ